LPPPAYDGRVSLRRDLVAAHPDFPWLDARDPSGVRDYLVGRGFLARDEPVQLLGRAGEGNMNLTLRVVTPERRLIVKQARPWVEKYAHIAAPWDRGVVEARFYARVASIPAVRAGMPALLGADPDARVLVLEDLGDGGDCTGIYGGATLGDADVEWLAAFLRALHDATGDGVGPELANREMRALNPEHCFVVPLARQNGLDLDRFEPGLRALADRLSADEAFVERTAAAGRRYLADGPCLVHGDYFPGSWLRTAGGLRVIDPEFCHPGDPEHDVGVALGHLAIAGIAPTLRRRFLDAYATARSELVAAAAAVEVTRRLLGVAQLPLPPSDGRRARLVQAARAALLTDDPGPLLEVA
jgi:5-methylthioribose kinase